MNTNVLVTAVALVAFGAGAGVGYASHHPTAADPVAARVNGEIIPQSQLATELQTRFGPPILRDIIDQKVVQQEAAKEKIIIPPAELKKKIAEYKKQPMTQSLMKAGDLTDKDLERNLSTVMALDILTEKHIKEDDEKEFLLHHREELETVDLQKVTFPDEETARKALSLLQAPGADIRKLNPEEATVHRSELEPAWAESLFRMRTGELSPILNNESGYHIYKIGPHHFEYKELRGIVHEQLLAEKRKETLEDLRHKATIEVVPPFSLPPEVDEAAAPAPTGTPKPGKTPRGVPSGVPVETD